MKIIPFERSYWVLPGRLLAGEIAAAMSKENTLIKLESLAECGIRTIINLMEADETDHYNNPFFDYSQHVGDYGMEMERMPVRDLSVPSRNEMIEILNKIDDCHTQNKAVYVHCWGGIGRTGTVVGCYLIRHGYANPENVLSMIEYLMRTTNTYGRTSPETVEQIDFVKNWKLNQ